MARQQLHPLDQAHQPSEHQDAIDDLNAHLERKSRPVVHLQTSTSTVRCGARMAPYTGAIGWTLGDVTVDYSRVTCDRCRHA